MDIEHIRYAWYGVSLLAFIGVWFWAFSARNKAGFDEAQQLPFIDSGERE